MGKDSDAGRDWGQEEKGTTEDEMAGWHHRPIFPSGCEGKLGVALESLQGLRDLTLCNPMDCSPPGSSIHGIFQARVLEWGAIAFSVQLQHQSSNEYAGLISFRMDWFDLLAV